MVVIDSLPVYASRPMVMGSSFIVHSDVIDEDITKVGSTPHFGNIVEEGATRHFDLLSLHVKIGFRPVVAAVIMIVDAKDNGAIISPGG